jgi:hypothetical protein
MATVTPIKRNNSKTDNRTIPINVAKNLIKRHIEQMVANTHQTSADFPTTSEYFGPPSRNMNGNFIPETPSYNIPPGAHNTDKSKTYLQFYPGHKIASGFRHLPGRPGHGTQTNTTNRDNTREPWTPGTAGQVCIKRLKLNAQTIYPHLKASMEHISEILPMSSPKDR